MRADGGIGSKGTDSFLPMVLGRAICLVPPAFAGWHLTVLRTLWQYVLSPGDAHMISFWLSHNNVVRSGIWLLWYFKHPQCKEFSSDLLKCENFNLGT